MKSHLKPELTYGLYPDITVKKKSCVGAFAEQNGLSLHVDEKHHTEFAQHGVNCQCPAVEVAPHSIALTSMIIGGLGTMLVCAKPSAGKMSHPRNRAWHKVSSWNHEPYCWDPTVNPTRQSRVVFRVHESTTKPAMGSSPDRPAGPSHAPTKSRFHFSLQLKTTKPFGQSSSDVNVSLEFR